MGLADSANLYQGESFAASIDIDQAGAALEMARTAPDQPTTLQALTAAAHWLRQAQGVYVSTDDLPYANRVDWAAGEVEAWIADAANWGPLPAFQAGTIFPFQGVLRQLAQDASFESVRDNAILWWGAFALVGSALIALSFDDYKAAYQRARRG